jgi:1-acyl-sn-glycerol-3-phosphate acyltransferase
MWLLPAFSLVCNAAARIYYRLTFAGERVPDTGPVLLVANHPNSLLDPMLVAAAARRPVRFLAKAPLFTDRKVGWLVRASGAIPVYRQVDDPEAMDGNVDMFRGAHAALAGGAALGIFPEGISHSDPAIAALKTGAARIALGTLAQHPQPFPIVPVGLVFRRRDVFRSEALVVIGRPADWSDLAGRTADDREAVRDLTGRIDSAMRQVTVNLERWEDQPLVNCAEAVWQAEWGADTDPARKVERLGIATSILSHIRKAGDPQSSAIVDDVAMHCRQLERLRVTPGDLAADVRLRASLRWGLRRFYLVGAPAFVVALAGLAVSWLPNQVTGRVAMALRPDVDQRSTFNLLIGMAVYLVWIGFLAALVSAMKGVLAGAAMVLAVPAIGVVGRRTRERWRGAWQDARRFFLLRARRELVQGLRKQQREIAEALKQLYDRVRGET